VAEDLDEEFRRKFIELEICERVLVICNRTVDYE